MGGVAAPRDSGECTMTTIYAPHWPSSGTWRARLLHFSVLFLALAFTLSGCQDDGQRNEGPAPDQDVSQPPNPDTDDVSDVDDPSTTPDAPRPPDVEPRDTGEEASEPGPPPTEPPRVPLEPLALAGVEPPVLREGESRRVWLYGAGFSDDTAFLVEGEPLSDVDVIDEYVATAVVPALSPGVYALRATQGTEAAHLPEAMTVFAALRVDRVQPERLRVRGGTPLDIQGAGFEEGMRVLVGGRPATDVRVRAPDRLEAWAPPGEAGPADLRLSTSTGTVLVADAVEYVDEPRVTAVEPPYVPVEGAVSVEVVGAHLDRLVDLRLRGLSQPMTEGSVRRAWSAPPGPEGWAEIVVHDAEGPVQRMERGVLYVAADGAPRLVGATPARVPATGGDVLLHGVGLDGMDTVHVDGREVDFERVDASTLRLVGIAGEAGTHAAVRAVHESDGQLALDSAWWWSQGTALAAIEPNEGPAEGGLEVVVTGQGFHEDVEVYFGGRPAEVLVVHGNELRVRVPPGSAGWVDVELRSDGERVLEESAFRYFEDLHLAGVAPARGAQSGGTEVLLVGGGFHPEMVVHFGDREASEVVWLDSSTARVRAPHADGPGTVDVRVSVGDESALRASAFTYFEPFSGTLGWGGAGVDGAMHLTVLSIPTGEPIEGAYLTLDRPNEEPAVVARTDVRGQATLSRLELEGAQTLHVGAPCHSSSTVRDVNAENLTMTLDYICEPEPDDGDPPPPIYGILTGRIEGLEKLSNPGPGKTLIGVAYATFGSPYSRTPQPRFQPPSAFHPNATFGNGYFGEIYVYPGPRGVVALCGVYDEMEDTFEPLAMGIARDLIVDNQETVEVAIDCAIPLSESLTVKLPGSPALTRADMDHEVLVYLDLGADGWIGGWTWATGREDILTVDLLPRLAGPLEDISLLVYAGAFGPGSAASITIGRGVRSYRDVVRLPAMLDLPVRRVPLGSSVFRGRFLEWALPGEVQPGYFWVLMDDLETGAPLWEAFVPGDRPMLQLPYFPADAEVEAFPDPGSLIAAYVFAIRPRTFRFDNFRPGDLNLNNWDAYSVDAWMLVAE